MAAWPIAAHDASDRVIAFIDDAFYYFELAGNVVAGHGFTFDGIQPTNGFQPLWLFMLLPLFAVVPGGDARLVAVGFLQAALLALGTWLVWRLVRRRIGPVPASLVVLVFFALPGARDFWRGMESAIVLLTLAMAWHAWLRFEESGPGERDTAAWRFGWAAALMSMARLEGAIGVTAVIGVALVRARRAGKPWGPGTMAALVLPMGMVIGAYATWSQWLFGTPAPVSGQVKAYWVSRFSFSQRMRTLLDLPWPGRRVVAIASGPSTQELWALMVPLLLLLAGLAVAWRKRERVAAAIREAGVGFPLVACAAIALSDHLVVGPYLGEWAMLPAHLCTAITMGLLLARTPAAPHAAAALVLLVAARVPLETFSGHRLMQLHTGQIHAMALQMRERLPAGALVISPFAGVLAYYSDQRVVTLDGLMGSEEYLREVVRAGRWEAWVRRERPDVLIDVDCGAPGPPTTSLNLILGRPPRGAGCLTRDDRLAPVPPEARCRIVAFTILPEACEP